MMPGSRKGGERNHAKRQPFVKGDIFAGAAARSAGKRLRPEKTAAAAKAAAEEGSVRALY